MQRNKVWQWMMKFGMWVVLPSLVMVNVDAAEERPLNSTVMTPRIFIAHMDDETFQDGGFEAGTPSTIWHESSLNYETPICHQEACGEYGRSGDYYAWFGGLRDTVEAATLTQTVTIEPTATMLIGYLRITNESGGGVFQIAIDNESVAEWTQDDAEAFAEYTLFEVDLNSYSDGMLRELKLSGVTTDSGLVNFFVDDIELSASEPTNVKKIESETRDGGDVFVIVALVLLIVWTGVMGRRGVR